MFLKIHPDNPDTRKIQQVVDCLLSGGIIVYPTDTVYGLGCDITNPKAIEKLCRLKGIDPKKANLSFICHDFSHLDKYALPLDKGLFRLLKQSLPGPYTFILKASGEVPKLLKSKKKTVGIRVPDNNIARAIVEALGNPIISTSLKIEDDVLEYPTDPEIIFGLFEKTVDIVIDGGITGHEPSTVVDCTGSNWEVIREGKGSIDF